MRVMKYSSSEQRHVKLEGELLFVVVSVDVIGRIDN